MNPAVLVVLIFTRTDCPVANRYAPEINRLHADFAPRGVGFKLVYAEPGVTAAAIETHRKEYGLAVPGIADANGVEARRAGATVTPEVAVYAGGRLVYRGRIDDRQTAAHRTRIEPTRRDLEDVLRALAAGRTPRTRITRAAGCAIEKLP